MSIWDQIKKISSKEDEKKYERKMKSASESTVISLKKLAELSKEQ